MDTSLVSMENEDDDSIRSSSESSSGFGFTRLDLRKNLAHAFDGALTSKKNKQMKEVVSYSKLSIASCDTIDSHATTSLKDRIAQFEHAATSNKPPLPAKKGGRSSRNNHVPSNRVSVYLRIRPLSAKNAESGSTIEIIAPSDENPRSSKVRTYPPSQSNSTKINMHRTDAGDQLAYAREFEFHEVLDPETTQKSAYNAIAAPLVESLFADLMQPVKGTRRKTTSDSALLFAYGITNAGKTHTIVGDVKTKTDARWGIVPRAISDGLDRIKQIADTVGHYDLYLSYFEIYNEQIHDLLPKSSKMTFMGPPSSLKIRERQGQTVVKGLARYQVRDIQHGIELVTAANGRRQTSSNNLNNGSSRSHCICQMQLVPRTMAAALNAAEGSTDAGYNTDEEANFQAKTSTLWIVDLAGSERSKRTGLVSVQQKEASMINKSLMTLTRCLSLMKDGKRGSSSSSVIPFRESKLTHLFMGHLTGHCASKTSMVVNVSPSVDDFDETQHVLAYASQARTIQVDPEQFKEKRKLFDGAESAYDLNGRKRQKTEASKNSKVRGFISKVVKKLTPRKGVRSKKKRKHGQNPCKNSSSSDSLQERNASSDRAMPATEKVLSLHETRSLAPSNHDGSHGATAGHQEGLATLNSALDQAKQEIEKLRTQKARLLQDLNNQESKVRLEVAEEMEEQIVSIRQEYDEVIERLRSQIQTKPAGCRSTKKAQRDKAEQQIEELMDRVDECEEEMIRMRETHAQEVTDLKKQLKEASSAVNDDGTAVTANPTESATSASNVASNSDVNNSKLQRELLAANKQIEQLKKSKKELIDNYEKLLEDESSESAQNDENAPDAQEVFRKSNRTMKTRGRPLQTRNTTNNIESDASSVWEKQGHNQQWLFPQQPSTRDEKTGQYRKPPGRAPRDREWDGSVGAWLLVA